MITLNVEAQQSRTQNNMQVRDSDIKKW